MVWIVYIDNKVNKEAATLIPMFKLNCSVEKYFLFTMLKYVTFNMYVNFKTYVVVS